MIFNCHYVKGFIIVILYVYLIIGIYKNSLELSQIIRKKTADKKTVLEYEQSYFNIIYTFFKYYISDK